MAFLQTYHCLYFHTPPLDSKMFNIQRIFLICSVTKMLVTKIGIGGWGICELWKNIYGIDQVKGSKDIDRTTQPSDKSGLTLTFEHVTWKSIGIIYSLRDIPTPSMVLIKWRAQKILTGQHTGLRRILIWRISSFNFCFKGFLAFIRDIC